LENNIVNIKRIYLSNFEEVNKDEINSIFQWFLSVKEDLRKSFITRVYGNPKTELSAYNLEPIYQYLIDNIYERPTTREEKELELDKVPLHLRHMYEISEYTWIDESLLDIFSLGIYFGELLKKNNTELEWSIQSKKNMANYGHPILSRPNSKINIPPHIVANHYASKILKGVWNKDKLKEMYELWLKSL
jgi:hypothetical protein